MDLGEGGLNRAIISKCGIRKVVDANDFVSSWGSKDCYLDDLEIDPVEEAKKDRLRDELTESLKIRAKEIYDEIICKIDGLKPPVKGRMIKYLEFYPNFHKMAREEVPSVSCQAVQQSIKRRLNKWGWDEGKLEQSRLIWFGSKF